MKIGELAQACQMSKDTIRYYVEKGLLLPLKKGAQMDFTKRELEDLRYIQKMKHMRFSIRQMQAAFALRRLSNLIEPDTIQAYEELLNHKKKELREEIALLKDAYRTVDQELKSFQDRHEGRTCMTGVPLNMLQYLCCPHCQKQLQAENARIAGKYLISGRLHCGCGYQAVIADGIVDTGNRYLGEDDHPDLKRGLYRDVGEEFVTGLQKCSDLVMERLSAMELRDQVVMETNINGYFFLYNHIREIDPLSRYIITDRYPEMLHMYKQLIESMGLDLDILFIADDSEQLPLLHGCAQVLLDFFGSNEHFLYKQSSFIGCYQNYLCREGQVLGALFGFERGSRSLRRVPEIYRHCSPIALDVEQMLETYRKEHYRLSAQLVASTEKTYDQYSFVCHQDGEPLRQYYYEAERTPQKHGVHSNFLKKESKKWD